MINIEEEQLEEYLSSIYNTKVKILFVGELSEKIKKPKEKLKGFGYGTPYLIEFNIEGKTKRVVLETVRPSSFGHDHFSDRAQIALWQHSTFNKLPNHVPSIDVGAFTHNGLMKSAGNCKEYFIITQAIKGKEYAIDLDRIRKEKTITQLDVARCKALSNYLAKIHVTKNNAPDLYVRRIRELIGHGECIMGVCDNYPSKLKYIDEKLLCKIEKKCVEWRWKIKQNYTHRCSQVHGDFHPWNILFRKGKDFTILDRSRGEWGDPADDLSALSINYIFYSLLTYGKLEGPFKLLFDLFWNNYLAKTGDTEVLKVIQPFYAWRGLVLASPIWYPKLDLIVRVKLFSFVRKMLETDLVNLRDINSYIKGE